MITDRISVPFPKKMQELRMLSTVTFNCQVKMNSGSQLSELKSVFQMSQVSRIIFVIVKMVKNCQNCQKNIKIVVTSSSNNV